MKVRAWSSLGYALLFFTLRAFSQNAANPQNGVSANAPVESGKGVVVEEVKKSFAADQAGLQEGDILLRWSCGDARGEIQSPFDLAQIEVDQAPRGVVTIEGIRGAEKHDWMLGPGRWGVLARPNLSGDLLSIHLEAEKLVSAGKLQDAIERWRSAAQKAQEAQSSWLGCWFLSRVGDLLASARQWGLSDAVYEETMQSCAGASTTIKAQVLRSWAESFQQRADWQKAESRYQDAADEMQKSGSENLVFADTLANIGYSAMQRGDLEKSEKYLSRALEIEQRLASGSLTAARILNGLGNLAVNRSDLAGAEKYYSQALAIREKLDPGSLSVASSLNNLGVVALNRGDLAKTKDYYLQALRIREKAAPGSRDVADSLNNLGNVFRTSGDLAKAKEYLRQALLIREALGPGSLDVAKTLNNLSLSAYDIGDLSQAEDYLRQSISIKEKLAPGSLDLAGGFNNLANILRGRGDLKEAEEYYRRALAINEKKAPGSLDLAQNLNNLGKLAEDRGAWAEAEDYHHQALVIAEKVAPGGINVASSLDSLGCVALARGHQDQAEQYFHQFLDIQEKIAPGSLEVAAGLTGLANVFRDRGDLARAEEYYRRALTIWEKLAPEKKDYAETLATLAGVMLRKQQSALATPLFEKALNVLESHISHLGGAQATRSRFRAQHADYYQDYIDLLMRQKRPDMALQVLERSRAQTLLEMLVQGHIDVRRGIDGALIERERSLQADISAKVDRRIRLHGGKHTDEQVAVINQEVEALLSQLNDVEGQIRASSPSYAALTRPQPLSTQDIQRQLLDADTLLLEYSLGEDRSYVFAVTPATLASYELPKRAEIEGAARFVYALLTARNRVIQGETERQRQTRIAKADAEYADAAFALSQMILAPVAADLKGKRLLIVGEGALQYIPFAILPELGTSNLNRGLASKEPEPLMAEHEIVNLPSASVLAVLRRDAVERKAPAKAVAVLADPVFTRNDARVGSAAAHKKHDDGITPGAEERELAAATSRSNEHLTRSVADIGLSPDGFSLPRLRFTRREAEAIMAVTPAGMTALDFDASRMTAASPELANYRVIHFATHGLLDSEHPELSGLVFSLVDKNGNQQNGFLELEDIYNLNLPADLVVLSACESGLGKQVRGEGLVGLTRGFMYAGASRVMASLWKVDDVATAELMGRFYKFMEKDGISPAAALRQAQIEMWRQKDWRSPYYWAAFQMQGEWR